MAAPIEIVDYDPAWTHTFEAIQSIVWNCLKELVSRIEHVGSTAVLGLAAKPIIDVDVLLADASDLMEAVARLERLGYRHQGNLGIEGREAFVQPPGQPNITSTFVCPGRRSSGDMWRFGITSVRTLRPPGSTRT